MGKSFYAKLLFTSLISYTSPAYAYLDPGTGSMLVQGLIDNRKVRKNTITRIRD